VNTKQRSERTRLRRLYQRLVDAYGPQGWWPTTPDGEAEARYHSEGPDRILSSEERWEIVVGSLLTQNTSWAGAAESIRALRAHGALSPWELAHLDSTELSRLIKPSRYHNQKARRLQALASYVLDRYSGDVTTFLGCGRPDLSDRELRDELLVLDGIGPETADSILLYAAQRPVFVIDAYTKRICARLGFVEERVSYEELQALFVNSLKGDTLDYNEYHALLVRHAVEHCRVQPLCSGCCLRRSCRYVGRMKEG